MSRGRDALTTIPLRKSTRDRLKGMGLKTETYDDILNRLMDFQEGRPGPKPSPGRAARTPPRGLVAFEPIEEGEG